MVLSSPWAIVLIHRNHHSTASAIAGKYNRQNMGAKQWRDFKYLRESALKTTRAWAIKEWAIGE
uniref:Uncharacterized protein n=1 Tax=Candidatus Kentrum sp. LPFa TaxID=2126335 RepID=A0A450X5X1_9GAMM|nr:MAG: hypothetical protein BECKLPF1236A_GA0070988_100173 [Candidatus Kentron sp. LPFa]VFK24621.1 MAG: hypothetical protein BECKLPF1236C_GA0070990_100154 [Candidatus Kentron sp. LPFa]